MTRHLAGLLACLLAAGTIPAAAMTPDEAYEAISHRHAALDPTSAGFSREEGAYLMNLFQLIDLAIVENVQTWTWFQSEGKKGSSFQDYRARVDALIAKIDRMPAPARLGDIHTLLVQAIRDQRSFFESWLQADEAAAQGRDNREPHRARMLFLRSSSARLHEAYDRLVKTFPNAGQQNFDAFYDHLCVLDLL